MIDVRLNKKRGEGGNKNRKKKEKENVFVNFSDFSDIMLLKYDPQYFLIS